MRIYFPQLNSRAPLGAVTTPAQIQNEMKFISNNVGNLVHLEAMPKMLFHTTRGLESFCAFRHERIASEAFDFVDRHFDAVALSFANAIRRRSDGHRDNPRAEPGLENSIELLKTVKRPVYVVGLGLQDPLPPSADAIDPHVLELLKLVNERAALFAVRGSATEAWLHSIGLTRAIALGCPSMFVYPKNILSIAAPSGTDLRLGTAGRMQLARTDRFRAINRIGEVFDSSYIFQNDFFNLARQAPYEPVFNDATGEVSEAFAQGAVHQGPIGWKPAFKNYYLFRTVESWRTFAATRDAFFGDRFHGAVPFMQSGRPAIIVSNDLRVQELTEFHGIPAATTAELLTNDPRDIIADRLSDSNLKRFKEVYIERCQKFRRTLAEAGLKFVDETSTASGAKRESSAPKTADHRERAPTAGHHIQHSNVTKVDRYPTVFDVVRKIADHAGVTTPRILSYGCSTGEEAQTLATTYFPTAVVVGVDVAEDALAQARERYGDNPRLQFETSSPELLAKLPPFDIIFAMSVLCRWPQSRNMDDISEFFPFVYFEQQAELLDSILRPGGLLVIYNSSYGFLDTVTARGYDVVFHAGIRTNGMVKRFQRDGRWLAGAESTDCIYRKRTSDLADVGTGLVIRNASLRRLGVLQRPRDP